MPSKSRPGLYRRINWIWVPPFLVYTAAIWLRNGIIGVALMVLVGIALIVVVEQRAKRKGRL